MRQTAVRARRFVSGQQVWFRGERVVFVDYMGDGASIRRGRADICVVPLYKLALDRNESLVRATTIQARSAAN